MTKESALNRIIADIEDRFELRYSKYVQQRLESDIKYYFDNKKMAEYDLTEFDNGFYLGKWQNGKRNGFGVNFWYHGDKSSFYMGIWKDNQMHGNGIYCYLNHQIYWGGFVNDKQEGEDCYYVNSDGLAIQADFKNDNIVKVIYSENDFTYNGRHFKNTIGRESSGSDSGSSCLGFIIMVAIIWGCFKYCGNCSSSSDSHYRTEVCETTTTYICTARKSLKVRVSPNTSASQIGNIMSGEEVEVYSIVDGFAKIRFNDDIGYASSKYLKQK